MSWIPDNKVKSLQSGPSLDVHRSFAVLILVVSILALTACDFRLDNDALIARARLAAEQHEYRTAIIDLKTVLQRDSRNADARLALGRVYIQVAEPYAAEKELRKAVEFGSPKSDVVVFLGQALLAQKVFDLVLVEIDEGDAANDADRIALKLIRGDAQLALGRLDQARQLYVEVLETDQENPAAYLGMASVFVAEGQPEQAAVSIDRAIEVAPDFAPAWMARAAFRLNQRLPDVAENDLEKALDLATERNDVSLLQAALAGLTDAHLLQGDVQSAERSARRLNSIAEHDVTARYTTARVAVAKEDLDTAVTLLQGVLKDSPDFRQAHLLFGAVSRAKGNLAQAEMYLASAVRAWPDNVQARKLLADVRLRQHKFRDATEAIEPMLNNDEQVDDYLLAAAGVIKLQSGEYSEGLELFRRSVDADPSNLERKMDLATIHLAIGQVDEAVEILESLAGTDIDKHRLDVLNVVSLHRRGDLNNAIHMAGELLELSPDNVQLYTVLGGLHEESGDLAAARRSLAHVLRLDTANVAALLQLGRIDVAENRYEDARLRYRRALQIAPENVPVIIEMARLATLEGDVATSTSWLEKARDSNEDALLPRIHLTTLYLSQQRHDEAMLVAKEAVLIDGRDARARNLLGVTQMAASDFDSAAENFAEALRLGPDIAAYRYNAARAEFKRGNERMALRMIEENCDAHPDHVPSARLLAEYHLQNGDFPAATAVAQGLQTALPQKAASLALQGDILAAQERFRDAVGIYDRAFAVEQSRDLAVRGYSLRVKAEHPDPYGPILKYLESNSTDSAARMFLAETYHSNGEFDNAAAEYERLLHANPDNVVALNNLAWILLDRGSPRALELAEAAYRILPDNASIADTYGWILLKQSESETASRILRKAAEEMPANAEIHYHFAVALLEIGNEDEAYAVLERIVASEQSFVSRSEAEKLIRTIQRDE